MPTPSQDLDDDQQAETIRRLSKSGVEGVCRECGSAETFLMPWKVRLVLSAGITGAMCYGVSCPRCGFIKLFNARTVDADERSEAKAAEG